MAAHLKRTEERLGDRVTKETRPGPGGSL
jgi:hypothetical protein